MSFSVNMTRSDGEAVLLVAGEADLATAGHLREAGEQAVASGCAVVRVHLNEVTFMDSTALSVLIALRKLTEESGQQLLLSAPSPNVVRLLEVAGLDTFFQIDDVSPE